MKFAFRTLIIFVLASLLIQSCASVPTPLIPTPVIPTLEMPTATKLVVQDPPTLVPATATLAPSPMPASTATSAPTSRLNPDPIRETPASLMLHRKNAGFDAVQFVRDFIGVLKQTDLQVTTYRQLAKTPELSVVKKGKLFIFSIDDIYLRYPIDPSVKEMIGLLLGAGYPAVLGVITDGSSAYPETVDTLRTLQGLGWEIASHSDTHRNLADVEKMAPKSVYPEIKASLDKLEAALGLRPITLILPEGQMTRGDQQIKRSGVLWVVGINGGTRYDSRAAYYYVGREGPDGDAQNTLAIMLKRFSP